MPTLARTTEKWPKFHILYETANERWIKSYIVQRLYTVQLRPQIFSLCRVMALRRCVTMSHIAVPWNNREIVTNTVHRSYCFPQYTICGRSCTAFVQASDPTLLLPSRLHGTSVILNSSCEGRHSIFFLKTSLGLSNLQGRAILPHLTLCL